MDNKNLRKIYKFLNNNLVFIFFSISIILILFANSKFSPFTDYWNQFLEKTGFVSLTSGVFAAVLKSIQFTGLFKEELNKVISGTELLDNRKDLPALWKKISKIIYTEKFPEISDLIEDRVLETYFPTNKNHFIEDMNISINVDSFDENQTITYCQTINYTAVLDSKQLESNFEFESTLTDDDTVDERNELVSLQIDGEEMKGQIQPEITENEKKYSISLPLRGKKKFKIFQEMKRKYSMKGENFKLMRFNTFTKNVDITIGFPDDVEVSFFGIGVVKDFDKTNKNIKNMLSRRHRGDIILPKQGFWNEF